MEREASQREAEGQARSSQSPQSGKPQGEISDMALCEFIFWETGGWEAFSEEE